MTRVPRPIYPWAMRLWATSFVLALCALAASATDTVRTEAAGLRFAVPAAWNRVPAPSDVRAAQWRLPAAAPDAGDGELVLFYFGKGKGGGVQENLDRWYAQVAEPDGRPSRDAGVVTIRTVNGLRVTSLDLPGTYRPTPMGGGPTEPRPGSRLLAAAIEGEDGPWFLRAVGSDATIVAAKPGFDALLGSLETHR